MNCESYIQLDDYERKELIQKVCHLIQTSETHFRDFNSVVRQAESNELFKGLNILRHNFIVIEDTQI